MSKPENFEPVSGKIQSFPEAVCYFFGRDLYKQLGGKIPIGLVAATRGGTKVESFMTPDAIADETCGGTGSQAPRAGQSGPTSHGRWSHSGADHPAISTLCMDNLNWNI